MTDRTKRTVLYAGVPIGLACGIALAVVADAAWARVAGVVMGVLIALACGSAARALGHK